MYEPQRQMAAETYAAVAKTGPPTVISAAAVAGLSINEWVAIATGIYVALQAAYLVWRWVREARRD